MSFGKCKDDSKGHIYEKNSLLIEGDKDLFKIEEWSYISEYYQYNRLVFYSENSYKLQPFQIEILDDSWWFQWSFTFGQIHLSQVAKFVFKCDPIKLLRHKFKLRDLDFVPRPSVSLIYHYRDISIKNLKIYVQKDNGETKILNAGTYI